MGLPRGLRAVLFTIAAGCSVERIDLASRDAGIADVAPADIGPGDAAPAAAAPPPLSCNALGDFQGVLPAARDDRDPPQVFFSEAEVLAHGRDLHTGSSMALVGDRIWWGDASLGCGPNDWRLRTWSVPLDPDLRRDAAPRCESGALAPALVPEIAFNSNVFAVCFQTHPIPRRVADGGVVFGDYRVECGRLAASGGPGTWRRTLPSRPGLRPQLASLDMTERAVVASELRQSLGLAYATEDGATWLQRLDSEVGPIGEAIELPDAPRAPHGVVSHGGDWWIVRAVTGALPADTPGMDIVRVGIDGSHRNPVTIPEALWRGLRPSAVRVASAFGGVAMLALSGVEEPGRARVDYLLACGDAVVARRSVIPSVAADSIAWVPIESGWLVFVSVAAAPGGNPALEAMVLDPRGVQRGAVVRIEERGSVGYLRAVRGTGPDDVWIVYMSVAPSGDGAYKLRRVRVREAR